MAYLRRIVGTISYFKVESSNNHDEIPCKTWIGTQKPKADEAKKEVQSIDETGKNASTL